MGHWVISRHESGNKFVLTYVNIVTGESVECGVVHCSVKEQVIIDWIIEHGKPSPGDFIHFKYSGRTLHYQVGNAQA